MKILIMYGTRPEFLKLIPVIKLMEKDDFFDVTTLSTGQHSDLMTDLYEDFDFEPKLSLNLMQENQTPQNIISKILSSCDGIDAGYDYIMVQGDTATVFGGALAGFLNKTPVIHIEAGMRTFDLTQPFPEEGLRQMISMITTHHFCPTSLSSRRLAHQLYNNHFTVPGKDGEKDVLVRPTINCVGNTIIDTVKMMSDAIGEVEKNNKLITLTLHRRENIEVLDEILITIKEIAENNDVEIVCPVHPNPNVKNKIYKYLEDVNNVKLIDPLTYKEMIKLLKRSHLLMTDSGGLQEEAAALNLPTIVLRETTERMEGVKNGNAMMGFTKREQILDAFEKTFYNEVQYNLMSNAVCPYGDGKASERIINFLKGQKTKK